MNIQLSIIIPAYNSDKYIIDCLDSIYSQEFVNCEVIVVDDGSTDNTNNIIKKYIKNKKNIKIITTENNGVSHARNIGLEHALGKYIMFIDSDDKLVDGSLSYINSCLKKYDFDLFQMSFLNFSGCEPVVTNTEDVVVELNGKEAIEKIIKGNLKKEDITPGPCWKIYNSDVIKNKKIKFIEKFNMFEDGIFNIEILNNSNKVFSSNYIMYLYRKNVGTSLTNRMHEDIVEQKDEQIDYLREKINITKSKDELVSLFSFYSIKSVFRCFLYHPNNKMGYSARIKFIRKMMSKNNFRYGIVKTHKRNLNLKNRMLLVALKYKLYLLIDLIYKIKIKL